MTEFFEVPRWVRVDLILLVALSLGGLFLWVVKVSKSESVWHRTVAAAGFALFLLWPTFVQAQESPKLLTKRLLVQILAQGKVYEANLDMERLRATVAGYTCVSDNKVILNVAHQPPSQNLPFNFSVYVGGKRVFISGFDLENDFSTHAYTHDHVLVSAFLVTPEEIITQPENTTSLEDSQLLKCNLLGQLPR